MSKLAKKFMAGILSILLLTLAISLFVNTSVVERFYLYRQRSAVNKIGDALESRLALGRSPEAVIRELEQVENVLIAYAGQDSGSEALSAGLREKFRQKGLGFQKFWLWEQDYASILESGGKTKLYQQDRLNYGILVKYLSFEGRLFAIARIVPNTREVVSIINTFFTVLQLFSLLTALALIWILVWHITDPLKKIGEFSGKLGRQEYKPLCIKTGDELEAVADSINRMGESIQNYQRRLLEKNEQMEQLLDNVAHDLKTPISLIKLYASGIRDGLDDGSFLEVVIRQSGKMERLTEQLLRLSRIGRQEYPREPVRLDLLFTVQMEELKPLADARGLPVDASIVSNALVAGNPDLIAALFSNLLSNAFQYAAGGRVEARLEKAGGAYIFTISNQLGKTEPDLERIWEPLYVGETSRNEALSGTGLGLAIVKRIAEQSGYSIRCEVIDGWVRFTLVFQADGD